MRVPMRKALSISCVTVTMSLLDFSAQADDPILDDRANDRIETTPGRQEINAGSSTAPVATLTRFSCAAELGRHQVF